MTHRTLWAVACFALALSHTLSGDETTPVKASIWTDAEAVLAQALALRADALEHATAFRFGDIKRFTVSLEHRVGSDGNAIAEYVADRETFRFPIYLTYHASAEHKTSFALISPHVLANDDSLGTTLDHELGHMLADRMSRRVRGLPFYTVQQFDAVSRDEQLGLNIVSEGIGTYFGERLHGRSSASPLAFPESLDNAPGYTYRMVAFRGGLWLVRDILDMYGEDGLAWLVTHPFTATDHLRDAAGAYRDRALHELAFSARHLEAQRTKVLAYVLQARELLGVKDSVGVLIAEERHAVPGIALAVMRTYTLPSDDDVRVVFVPPALLAEAPDLLLEHIAMHETCHIARNDIISTRETEAGTEACVRTAVGQARYQAYVEAFTLWTPGDANLASAQANALTFLSSTIACGTTQ